MSALAILSLKDRIQLELHTGLVIKKLLQLLATLELLVCQTEQFERLIVRYKAPFDSQTLIGHCFTNHVESVELGLFALLVSPKFLIKITIDFLTSVLLKK